jgi:AraC-like DNA-binding protein
LLKLTSYLIAIASKLLPVLFLKIADFLTMPTIPFKNRSLTHSQWQQVSNYINTHLDRDLSLSQIARVINISPTYFASLFKRATGTSPHQYVIQQRVERAKLMLSKTDLAIANIALEVGFSSQSHLNQQFKRFTGMTPKQVRPSP